MLKTNGRAVWKDEAICTETVEIQISPTFFGWLAQFSGKMRIVEPKELIEQYKSHIN